MTDNRFFDAHQRATVEAAMARMIPTDDTPGAREAGTIDFLDRYLSGIDFVFAKPDGSGFETLEGKQAWAWEQRIAALRDTYVTGTEEQQSRLLTELERPAQEQEEQVADDQVRAAWTPPEPALQQSVVEIGLAFVPLLALHTRQGFYADPIYGGNRDRIGWQVIGFPGPQSLADVHSGRYSVVDWFADRRGYPGTEDERGA
jgi:gluconate 2-dehydrogenase gamma chain